MSFGHALYYPHINLTNKNWLKHALLFWDNISRIVPYEVDPQDSEDIIMIQQESDFIKNYRPDFNDTSNTFNSFVRIIERLADSDEFFHDRYFRMNGPRGRYSHAYKERSSIFSELARSSGTYIHVQKLDPFLRDLLFDWGLAIPGENQWENWVRIDNEIGMLYMTYLAKTISKRNSLPIVTDVDASFSAGIRFESKINSNYSEQFEYRLGNMVIDTVVPKEINSVPLELLLNIRRKYESERKSYFNEISSLAKSIGEIDNESALADALNHHSSLILKETENLRALYKSHKIETVNKFLGISLPTAIASLAEQVPDLAKPFLMAGGVILGLVSAASSVKKDRLELRKNPKSYLLNLKSELSGQDFISKWNDTIHGLRKL